MNYLYTAHVYRMWEDIASTMNNVKEMLLEQCGPAYLDGIKPHAVEYFHDRYTQKIREQLKVFQDKYGKQLAREKSRLEEVHNLCY